MKKIETSKKIVFWSGMLTFSQILLGTIFAYLDKSIELFVYSIPATSVIFSAAIIYYLNKAKMENVLKIKISYAKFKLRMSEILPTEVLEEVESEFSILEDSLNTKLDTYTQDSVSEEISSSQY